jgi:hypothetical protein
MAPEPKLSDADVKRMRQLVRRGAQQTDLADEYGVNRKTIWRRLTELERAEKEHAERLAAKRLRWQAERERRKLRQLGREGDAEATARGAPATPPSLRRSLAHDPYIDWLDRPKNLSGRALSEASGLVRVRLPDGSIRKAVEVEALYALFDEGWILDESFWDDPKHS